MFPPWLGVAVVVPSGVPLVGHRFAWFADGDSVACANGARAKARFIARRRVGRTVFTSMALDSTGVTGNGLVVDKLLEWGDSILGIDTIASTRMLFHMGGCIDWTDREW